MLKLITPGLGIAFLAVFAMGCGGGGADEVTPQLNEAQFMKAARTVCARTQKELTGSIHGTQINYRKLALALENEAEELEAIPGPDRIEERIEPMIKKVAEASRTVAREKRAALEDPATSAYKREAEELHLANC